ncbi:MAG: hypothetical protein E4H01_03125 [Lysobacterales bacterium]|nr:MAG: hypothetical protein E4H01_03125 [Xanthomonadales bacterium]
MSKSSKFVYPFVILLLAIYSVGCESPQLPNLAKAEGVVTYNDKPVEGAIVTMQNSQGVATGSTDDQGKFAMMFVQGGKGYPGAPIGKLTVAVTKTESTEIVDVIPVPEKTASEEETKAYSAELEEASIKHSKAAPPKSLIPERYGNAKTSGLKVELSTEGNTDIKLVLSDD